MFFYYINHDFPNKESWFDWSDLTVELKLTATFLAVKSESNTFSSTIINVLLYTYTIFNASTPRIQSVLIIHFPDNYVYSVT